MPDLTCEVANLPGLGAKRSSYGVDNPGGWSLNHVPLKLSGFSVDLYQRPVFLRERLVPLLGQQVHTTDMIVRNVPTEQRAKAIRVCEDLCWLLSLARHSQVRPLGFLEGARWEGRPTTARMESFRPPISTFEGGSLRDMLQQCWSPFRTLKRKRKLQEVIDYLTTAERREQPIEVKVLLAAVALENLKATYARKRGIPFKRGRFVHLTKKNKWASYSFAELLTMMLGEVGMGPTPKRVVTLRNHIVHYGVSTYSLPTRAEIYSVMVSLITEYLLRLLEYRGPFYDYASQETWVLY